MTSGPFRKHSAYTLERRIRAAFTLIELLTVIAIIGILTAIIIPAVNSARRVAYRAACASNMRQVGFAMAAYTSDHRDMLPGPLFSGMEANYQSKDPPTDGKLGSFLIPYLDFAKYGGSVDRRSPLFSCPAWSLKAPANQKFWRIQQGDVLMSDKSEKSPFGYFPSGTSVRWQNIEAPRSVWALTDLDKLNWDEPSNKYIPDKPVHGNVRNALFFDWHVGTIPVSNAEK